MGDRLPRTRVDAGTRQDGSIVHITPFETILITGESGAGKSTTVSALLERMRDEDYQFCVIDPEGDYSELEETVPVGDPKHEPNIEQVISLLEKPNVSTIVNLLAINPSERPAFFASFMAELSKFRAKTGRPHWLIVDEAHHCIPVEWQAAALTLPQDMPATIAVTVHPESVALPFLELVTTVIGVGKGAEKVIGKFCKVTGRRPSIRGAPADFQATGHVLAGDTLQPVVLNRPAAQRKRHVRKYAEGELGKDKSFYFRGPTDALNLRAQNLMVFLQLAEGVDDETWLHHLRLGHYSCWLKDDIKDPELADLVMAVEENDGFSARDSRKEIKAVIERKYTAPAKGA